MIQFDKNTNPVFQETSEWLPDRFQSRDRFHSHESLYMRRVQSPQDLFVHHWQLFHCSVRLYGEGGGRRGWRHFFSCGNNCFYSLSTHPLVRGTARPQTQQSLISFLHSHSLCCHATPLAIARGHKKTADCKIIELELRKYLDNRLCRIEPRHLLEFIVSALGKMKVMQIGDVGKPEKRSKNEM